MLVSLLILTFAVAGLALAGSDQQDPLPLEENQVEENQPGDGHHVDNDPQRQQEPSAAPAPACRPDRILVKVKPGADPATVIARYGGTIVQTIPGIEVQVVTVPGGTGHQAIDALNADPEVQYAEPDSVVRASDSGTGC
jgi:hypothetical protein